MALVRSKEYRLRAVKNHFGSLRSALGAVETSEKQNSAVQLWVLVAAWLVHEDPLIYLEDLEKEGVLTLPKKSENSAFRNNTFSSLPNRLGREILKKIVFENVQKLESKKFRNPDSDRK